jgi:hypothetical protein
LLCDPGGVSFGGVSLLRKTAAGFTPRPPEEVDALMLAAYGEIFDRDRLEGGLQATANALNRGDLELAMIATVQLRLPLLDADGASRVAALGDFLAKYDPNEPRDRRGRWTTGGAGSPTRPPPSLEAKGPAKPESHWDGVSHPTGGHLILAQEIEPGMGDNVPPRDPPSGPVIEPSLSPPTVPEGWDVTVDGAVVRRPALRNGQPWPEADAAAVRRILARGPQGTPPPSMWVYVPLDGKGPDLVGSDNKEEFDQPPGYAKVRLVGTPQITSSRGVETGHAADSTEEALRLARSNEFETIYFNRSLTMSTQGLYQSLIRPDVVAVARPDLQWEITHVPYETLSAGQTEEEQQDRMPKGVPWIAPIRSGSYKRARAGWLAYLGVRPCS